MSAFRTAQTTVVYTYRWLSGRPMDGVERTNATWLTPATKVYTKSGRASHWAKLPGWKRQAWRHGTTSVLIGGWIGYAQAPEVTFATAGTTSLSGLTYASWRAVQAWKLRQHTTNVVDPLERILRPVLWPGDAPSGWLHVPIDVDREGEVRVELPGYLGPDERARVLEIVTLKLGMSTDITHAWRYAGVENHLSVRRLPVPPKYVGLEHARDAMLAAPESAPLLGLGRRDKSVAVDLDAESPHVLISAGSGGGKSVITRSIVAQLMRHGAQAVFLDVKRQSHRWARNLPGVTYCRETAEIHDALIELAAEGDRRNRLTDDIADDVDTTAIDVGPRIVLVAEEMNATINRLATYWNEIRSKEDPKTSPAIKALGDILFMGRAVKIHVIAIAQMMTARTLGGPEARENFATRIMARYTMNAWKMLAPEVWPAPKSSRHRGRCQVVIGGEAHETQALFLTDAEAQEWATAGPVTVPVGWGVPDDLDQRANGGPGTPFAAPMTLADMARKKVVPLSYEALKKAKSRNEDFPTSIDVEGRKLYSPTAVRTWFDAREAQKAGATKEGVK